MCEKTAADFYDAEQGGFYLYGHNGERMILRPKETYDGAMPSGNSMMAYDLVRLHLHTGDERTASLAQKQLDFMSGDAAQYPSGYAMFLTALSDWLDPPESITAVFKDGVDHASLFEALKRDAVVSVLEKPTDEYPLKDGRTTFYVCRGHSCLPPVNDLGGLN